MHWICRAGTRGKGVRAVDIKNPNYANVLAEVARIFAELNDDISATDNSFAFEYLEKISSDTKKMLSAYIDGQKEALMHIRENF